jgi:hypothetical protein
MCKDFGTKALEDVMGGGFEKMVTQLGDKTHDRREDRLCAAKVSRS